MAALVGAVGCADVDVDVRVELAAISGGVADGDDHAVVGIYDTMTNAACTGTLIAPTLVLTAEHCVAPLLAPGECASFGPVVAAARLLVTTRSPISTSPRAWHEVAEIVVPPGANVVCGHDVAMLVLRAAIASTEASPIPPRLDEPVVTGETYAAIGYGQTSTTGDDSGLRRRLDGLTVACVGLECPSGHEREWVGERGVCAGDSGGPALDVAGRVIGVVSRGAFGCTRPVYGHVHAWRAWIEEQLARAGGSVLDGGTRDAGAGADDAADAGDEDASVALDSGVDAASTSVDAAIAGDATTTSPPSRGTSGCACVSRAREHDHLRPVIALLALCVAVRVSALLGARSRAKRTRRASTSR